MREDGLYHLWGDGWWMCPGPCAMNPEERRCIPTVYIAHRVRIKKGKK